VEAVISVQNPKLVRTSPTDVFVERAQLNRLDACPCKKSAEDRHETASAEAVPIERSVHRTVRRFNPPQVKQRI
jgi:hypothetical protein